MKIDNGIGTHDGRGNFSIPRGMQPVDEEEETGTKGENRPCEEIDFNDGNAAYAMFAGMSAVEALEPHTVKEARSCPDWPKWDDAINVELSSLKEVHTWDIVPRPPEKTNVVSMLAQSADNPDWTHWEGVKRVYRYLLDTKGWKRTFGMTTKGLVGYADADGASQEHRHAITGDTLAQVIYWRSQRWQLSHLHQAHRHLLSRQSTLLQNMDYMPFEGECRSSNVSTSLGGIATSLLNHSSIFTLQSLLSTSVTYQYTELLSSTKTWFHTQMCILVEFYSDFLLSLRGISMVDHKDNGLCWSWRTTLYQVSM